MQPDKVDKEKYNLVPVPLSVYEFLTTPLLTISSKLRVLCGLLGWIDPNPNDPNPGNLRDGKSTEESIREFMQRHFGNELYEKLVDPFISGVYAGSGDKLSMSAAFPKIYAYDENHTFSRSILENVLLPGEKVKGKPHLDPKLKSNPDATLLKLKPPPDGALANFRNGMNTFIQGVERALSAPDSRLGHNLNPAPVGGVRTNHKLIKLHYDRYYKKYIAHFSKTLSGLDSGIGCESENADTWEDVYIAANNVVIASPSFETSKILKHSTMEVKDMDMIVPLVPSPSSASDTGSAGRDTLDLLNALPYCPVAAVICAYPKSSLRNVKGQPGGIDDFKAFGMLVPRNVVSKINGNSSFSLLGSIWSSSLFPEGRAPKDYIVLVNFVGGSHNPQLVLGSPEKAAPSEEELVNIVHRDLGEILLHNGIELDSETSKPIVLAVKKWEKGIPQYVK